MSSHGGRTRRAGRRLARWTLAAGLLLAMIAPISRAQDDDALMARFDRMVRYNLDNPQVIPSAVIDSLAQRFAGLSLGERVAAWAAWFHQRGDIEYRYGRSPDGYVGEGRLCMDLATDCVLFMYRVTELSRSANAVEAVQFAFGTRFWGASVEEAILEDGRVNYDDPAHLDFAEEMVRSGIWGEDVTADCGEAVLDAAGSSKAEPDTVRFLPTASIVHDRLQSGDIIWMVGDEGQAEIAEQRRVGTLIHHIGIIQRQGNEVFLVHAAARPLPGVYEDSGVARVPLATYLRRIDRFKGIIVTRLKDF